MSDEELQDLASGSLGRRLRAKRAPKAKRQAQVLTSAEIDTLARRLQDSASRDEARTILTGDQAGLTRASLERLARALAVHVNKHDTRDALLNKIIETAIGVRLRSDAILGLNLKSSGGRDAGSD